MSIYEDLTQAQKDIYDESNLRNLQKQFREAVDQDDNLMASYLWNQIQPLLPE